jgi:Protein phosphatase 2C
VTQRDHPDAGPATDVAPAQHDAPQPSEGTGETVAAPGVPADTAVASGTATDDPAVAEDGRGADVAGRMPGAGDQEQLARSVEDAWNPEQEESATVTPSPAVPRVALGFNLAKIPDHGEDSDPIVRHGRHLGLVAVFDGMGGAGGTVYETPEGPRTGAYIASRVARDVVEPRMLRLLDPEWNLDGPAAARDLQRAVKQALVETLVGLNAPASGLRSRLIRALPTTMAMMALQRRDSEGDRWTGHLLWSGDSRVYVLHPETGTHQLTTDDIREAGDAMVNLRQDSVLSNVMSADTDFVVRHHEVELQAPFVAIAATDGCFGYLPSPMHFEHLILAALRDSHDADGWSTSMQAAISAVTGDDAAMGLLAVGANHAELQQLFAPRTTELERRWIQPLDALGAEVRRAEQALEEAARRQVTGRAQLWGAYKADYERYLGAPDERQA